MFSGIIENQAVVIKKESRQKQVRFGFRLQKKEKSLRRGESIAVNGVCLTVVKAASRVIEMDVVRETLRSTALGSLNLGDRVNIERSLRFGALVGGHLVSGHVDGVGTIVHIEHDGRNQLWSFKVPPALMPLIALKGSVAIDGISLTIQGVSRNLFTVAFIPHTLKVTNLGQKKVGDSVNLEADLIARYLQSILKKMKA